MLCMTRNYQPLFGRVKPGVYVAAGMNGVGLAKGTYLGHLMANRIAGIWCEDLAFVQDRSRPTWVPPEPLRSIGVKIRLQLEEQASGAEK
jgi:glycine/D-amino acid oxidase-like deaminating enzyme